MCWEEKTRLVPRKIHRSTPAFCKTQARKIMCVNKRTAIYALTKGAARRLELTWSVESWYPETCAGFSGGRCTRCCFRAHAKVNWGICRGCVGFVGLGRGWAAAKAKQQEWEGVMGHITRGLFFDGGGLTLVDAYCRMLVLSLCMNTWL